MKRLLTLLCLWSFLHVQAGSLLNGNFSVIPWSNSGVKYCQITDSKNPAVKITAEGNNGAKGLKIEFTSPRDFSSGAILQCAFECNMIPPNLQVVFVDANNVWQENNLITTCASSANNGVVAADKIHQSFVDYAKGGWVRFGKSIDFSKIAGLIFYVLEDGSIPKDSAFTLKITGLKILSQSEGAEAQKMAIAQAATQKIDLLKLVKSVVAQGNADPSAKKQQGLVKLITQNSPGISIIPGGGGYPGIRLNFSRPLDFSKNEILKCGFLVSKNPLMLSVVFADSHGVIQDNNMITGSSATVNNALLLPNQSNKSFVDYASGGWVRFGKSIDFTQIVSLTFYVTDQYLVTSPGDFALKIDELALLKRETATSAFRESIPPLDIPTGSQLKLDGKIKVFGFDAGEKIFSNTQFAADIPSVSSIKVFGAKNEYVLFSFALNSSVRLEDIQARTADFTNSAGAIISSNNVKIRYLDEVDGRFMKYPDPMPLLNDKNLSTESGKNLIVYLEMLIPANATAGNYKSSISISDKNGLKITVPLELKVLNFALPVKSSLRSIYDTSHFWWGIKGWPDAVNDKSSQAYKEMLLNIIKNFGEHRLTPAINHPIFNIIDDKNRAELQVEYQFDPLYIVAYNTHIKYHNFFAKHTTPGAERDKDFKNFLQDFIAGLDPVVAKIKKADLIKQSVVKLGDEPAEEVMDSLQQNADDMAKYYPEIPTLLVTSHLRSRFYGKVNIWCMPWHEVNFASPEAQKRRLAGDEMWAYGADYMYNDTYHPMNLRVNYWLYFQDGVQGLHYAHHEPKAYLNYPNDTYLHSDGLNPIPSLRWEMMRQGMQDFEYLTLLKKLLEQYPGEKTKYGKLLSVPGSLAASKTEYSLNPELWQKRKIEIAEAIEALQQHAKK